LVFVCKRAKPLLSVSMSFDTDTLQGSEACLDSGARACGLSGFLTPINPPPLWAFRLPFQVAALRSYYTRVCSADSAHPSSLWLLHTTPVPVVLLRSPRTLSHRRRSRVAARARRATSVSACVVRRARSLTPTLAGRPRMPRGHAAPCLCEDKFTQRTPWYLRHYCCPSRNATFRTKTLIHVALWHTLRPTSFSPRLLNNYQKAQTTKD
jgi:hypothetical protein